MRLVYLSLLVLAAALSGCDRDPPIPIVTQEPAAQETSSRRGATTQEFLAAPRKPLRLAWLPLTVQVPQQWEVKTLGEGEVVFLQGPTPHHDVQIQLSQRTPVSQSQIDLMHASAAKEMQRDSTIKRADLRSAGEMKIFERQSVARPTSLPLFDESGNFISEVTVPYKWTISVFVPRGEQYACYELNFVGLTADEYQRDHELLRQIIDSIRLDPAAAQATPAEPG